MGHFLHLYVNRRVKVNLSICSHSLKFLEEIPVILDNVYINYWGVEIKVKVFPHNVKIQKSSNI